MCIWLISGHQAGLELRMKLLSLALNSVGDSAWWLSLLFSYLFPVVVVISCSNYSHRHRVTEVKARSKNKKSKLYSDANYSPDCMHHPCFQNKFLIILVLLLCGIVLFFSCFNCTYLGYGSRTPITGVFRAALIISNAIFLTFNAGVVPFSLHFVTKISHHNYSKFAATSDIGRLFL